MISVLLVDDEPVILDIARAFLERHGEFSVTTVLSAEEGLALLNEQDFDAVVSDYEMPVMNGLGFLRSIREPVHVLCSSVTEECDHAGPRKWKSDVS